jgi:hypothetical protein
MTRLIYDHPVMDNDAPIFDPTARRIIGHVSRPHATESHWLVTARDGSTLARLASRPVPATLSLIFQE